MAPHLIILIGPAGSGKTTWARQFAKENNYLYMSSDDTRLALCGNAEDQSRNAEVFSTMNLWINNELGCGRNMVIDATHYNKKNRKKLIEIGKKYSVLIEAKVFNVPIEVCKARNSLRDRKVPDFVIDRHFDNFEMPTYEEGFDKITFMESTKI